MEIVAWYEFNGKPDVAMYEKCFFGCQPTMRSSTLEPSSNEINLIAPTPRFFVKEIWLIFDFQANLMKKFY